MYLWAPLHHTKAGLDDEGKPNEPKTFSVGDEITQGSMSDEDWNYLIATGVIREQEYPIPKEKLGLTSLESPREVIIREAMEAMEAAQSNIRVAEGRVEVPPEG